MFDELIKTIQDCVDRSVRAATAQLTEEIRQLKNADRISYSLKEAAENTGIPYDTLLARCRAGKIQYSQEHKGGSIYITREALEKYLAEFSNEEPKAEKVKMKISTR